MIASGPDCYFGGPEFSRGALRDVLLTHVENTPPGGSIDWATYYFRDRELARALVGAKRRGVNVTLVLERRPRIRRANEEVIKILKAAGGLGDDLQLVNLPGLPAPNGKVWKPQFHEKIYCFSHPRRVALVGSFNPSGDQQEKHPDVIADIGDHDIADNLLVGLTGDRIVTAMQQHIRDFRRNPPGLSYRFSHNKMPILDKGVRAYFWPRLGSHPVISHLSQVSSDARIKIAASHIRDTSSIRVLHDLAKRGVRIQIVVEATKRRVTPKAEASLRDAGIVVRRIATSGTPVPMHLKLVLIEDEKSTLSIFGSFNWTKPSIYLNHEIAVFSDSHKLFSELSSRWDQIAERTSIQQTSKRMSDK